MRIAREQIFGPVLAVIPYDDAEELPGPANDTEYGLAASVWTRDVTRVCAVLHLLAAVVMGSMSGIYVLVMVAMSLACLPCAVHALLAPTRRTWLVGIGMAALMLIAHPLVGILRADHFHMVLQLPSYLTAGLVVGPALSFGVAVLGAMATPRGW